MSEDTAHTWSAVPLAVSLAQFTEKLIARRGVEQSSILFEGQIGPATKALSARTNASVSATRHRVFRCQRLMVECGVGGACKRVST